MLVSLNEINANAGRRFWLHSVLITSYSKRISLRGFVFFHLFCFLCRLSSCPCNDSLMCLKLKRKSSFSLTCLRTMLQVHFGVIIDVVQSLKRLFPITELCISNLMHHSRPLTSSIQDIEPERLELNEDWENMIINKSKLTVTVVTFPLELHHQGAHGAAGGGGDEEKEGIAEKIEMGSMPSSLASDNAMRAPTRPALPTSVGSFWLELLRVSLKRSFILGPPTMPPSRTCGLG